MIRDLFELAAWIGTAVVAMQTVDLGVWLVCDHRRRRALRSVGRR